MKQSEAVLKATQTVLAHRGIDFAPTVTDARSIVDSDARRAIIDNIIALFESGQVEFKDTSSNRAKLADAKLLRNYVNGLVTNWFNKSKELNGGTTHSPKAKKKPVDPQLKELHVLKKKIEGHNIDPENLALIEQAIAEREAELAV
jgi:hypothetical protein